MGSERYQKHGELVRKLLRFVDWGPTYKLAGSVFGVSRDTLRRLGKRERPPGVVFASRLEAYLGFPVGYWVDGVPEDVDPMRLLPSGEEPDGRIFKPESWTAHGRGIERVIAERGHSQKRVALRFGVSRTTVRRVLQGQEPNVVMAVLFERHYGFPVAAWTSNLTDHLPLAA